MGQEGKDQHDTAGREAEAERSAREHQANANQVRHETVPAGPRDDRDQDAVRRNAEFAAASAREGRGHGTADDAAFPEGEWDREADDDAGGETASG